MGRVTRRFPEVEHLEHAWPVPGPTGDPHAGDEAAVAPAPYARYTNRAEYLGLPAVDADTHAAADRAFCKAYRAALDGDGTHRAAHEAAGPLLVDGPVRHDLRPPRPMDVSALTVDEAVLADIAESLVPDLGIAAPGRVLGPLSELGLPAWARMLAGAVLCFSPLVRPGIAAWQRYCNNKPLPPVSERAEIRAIGAAPVCVWAVEGDRIRPLHVVGPLFVPAGPMHGVPDAPAFVGRAVPVHGAHVIRCALPLPAVPPGEVFQRRLALELLRLRRWEARLSWEDLLRNRGELLYRTAAEWLWAGAPAPDPLPAGWPWSTLPQRRDDR